MQINTKYLENEQKTCPDGNYKMCRNASGFDFRKKK